MIQKTFFCIICLFYKEGCEHLKKWRGQSQPTPLHQKGKLTLPTKTPNFGKFAKEKMKITGEMKKQGSPTKVDIVNKGVVFVVEKMIHI